jgi:hypothetical protein
VDAAKAKARSLAKRAYIVPTDAEIISTTDRQEDYRAW